METDRFLFLYWYSPNRGRTGLIRPDLRQIGLTGLFSCDSSAFHAKLAAADSDMNWLLCTILADIQKPGAMKNRENVEILNNMMSQKKQRMKLLFSSPKASSQADSTPSNRVISKSVAIFLNNGMY